MQVTRVNIKTGKIINFSFSIRRFVQLYSVMLVHCYAALGRMSVECGPASLVLPAVDSSTETTTVELPNTTNTRDAEVSSVNITASDENSEEFLHPDHFGKVASVKAKFHYAILFEAGSKLVADRFEAGRRPTSNQL